jgi:hypothetical protein
VSGSPLRIVVPVTAITVHNVLTTILAARDLSRASTIAFFFFNDDIANTYTATIESGEEAAALDDGFVATVVVPVTAAGKRGQGSYIVGPDQVRSFYRVSAISSGGGDVAGAWKLAIVDRGYPWLWRP